MSDSRELSKEEVTKILRDKSKELLNKKYLNQDSTEDNINNEKLANQSFLEKAKSFGKSILSRGLSDNKCKKETKILREYSCHGNLEIGLEPCKKREKSSKYENSYFCSACGCGDKKSTQLVNIKIEGKEESYSKLDYPFVSCPLTMPGFSNYINSDNERKKKIEDLFGLEHVIKYSEKKD